MTFYTATVSTDGSGDGDNLDSNGNPAWSGRFHGYINGIRYDFAAGTAVTADTTVSEPNGLARTIDSVANSATDVTNVPAQAITGATDAFLPYSVDSSNLQVVIAQGGTDITDAVTVIVEIAE